MRITQSMMSRGYINRMSKSLQNLSRSNNRMSSQMKYTRMSDNTAEVSRALTVREQLARNEQHTTTIKSAEGILSSAESSLQTLNAALNNVTDRLLQADTGTMSENERTLIAREIRGLQDQMLQVSNSQYSDKYMFAGSGKGKDAPFEVDANGKLMYNGYAVDELVPHPTTGKPATVVPGVPPAANTYTEIDYNKDVYIDIGLGLNVNGTGVNAVLDPKSAMKMSISGLDAFGYGVNADGMPKNMYSLLGKIANDMESGNTNEMDKDLMQIKEASNSLLLTITDIGTRSSFLEDTWNRLDNESIVLKTAQQKLESVPLEEEAIYNKSFETSWMITLQLGSKLIPPSIFDFLR